MTTLERLRMNVQAYNKFMTDEYYDTMSIIAKFQNTHPIDREMLSRKAFSEKIISSEEKCQIPMGKGWEYLYE